ncbi:MAG: PGPGW domain-containing protein [Actinomycetota bacterium]|nr:PGPGW domain-containing protein [Actinomycetota bacterium]
MSRAQQMLLRLRQRKERHRERSRTYRVAFAIAGFAVLLAGIVLALPLVPGPGFVLIAIALGMLALEFAWAERALEAAVERLERGLDLVRRRRSAGVPADEPSERERSSREAA